MAGIYRAQAAELLARCQEYRRGERELEEIKAFIWGGTSVFVSPQDRELRDLMETTEGELDLIQFTVDADRVFPATLVPVSVLEARLVAYIGSEGE